MKKRFSDEPIHPIVSGRDYMSDLHDFEKQVMDWYENNWNGRVLPFFKKPALTIETSLSTGKYPWANEDAIEIVDDYFRRFNVDRKNFSFVKYWPNEEAIPPLNFLRSQEHKWRWVKPEPLTLKMLAESAKAGCWLYD